MTVSCSNRSMALDCSHSCEGMSVLKYAAQKLSASGLHEAKACAFFRDHRRLVAQVATC